MLYIVSTYFRFYDIQSRHNDACFLIRIFVKMSLLNHQKFIYFLCRITGTCFIFCRTRLASKDVQLICLVYISHTGILTKIHNRHITLHICRNTLVLTYMIVYVQQPSVITLCRSVVFVMGELFIPVDAISCNCTTYVQLVSNKIMHFKNMFVFCQLLSELPHLNARMVPLSRTERENEGVRTHFFFFKWNISRVLVRLTSDLLPCRNSENEQGICDVVASTTQNTLQYSNTLFSSLSPLPHPSPTHTSYFNGVKRGSVRNPCLWV